MSLEIQDDLFLLYFVSGAVSLITRWIMHCVPGQILCGRVRSNYQELHCEVWMRFRLSEGLAETITNGEKWRKERKIMHMVVCHLRRWEGGANHYSAKVSGMNRPPASLERRNKKINALMYGERSHHAFIFCTFSLSILRPSFPILFIPCSHRQRLGSAEISFRASTYWIFRQISDADMKQV